MQRGSFGFQAMKFAVVVIFWALVAGVTWLGVYPVKVAIREAGLLGGLAALCILCVLVWFGHGWIDAHNARRAERRGLNFPSRPEDH